MTWHQGCCVVMIVAALMAGVTTQDSDGPCITCMMACEYGFVNGTDGCPLCECADAPNPWVPCQDYTGCVEGYKCNNLQVQCESAPCYPVVHCIEFPRDGCPMPNYDELHCMAVRVGRFCEMDNQCDQGEICCEGDCGGSYCNLAPKPECPLPNNDPEYCALFDPSYDCEDNKDCDHDEICCVGDCTGQYCKKHAPKPECPLPNNDPEYCALVDPRYDCEANKDCDHDEICCVGDCTGQYCKKKGSGPVVCNACDKLCGYGNVMGNNGCPLCECQSAPNPRMPCEGFNGCSYGEVCEHQDVQCITQPCYPVVTCTKESGPVMCNYDCDKLCEYGNVMGQDGCATCECQSAPNPWMPCEGFNGCTYGEVCEHQEVQCIAHPCYPVVNCIKEPHSTVEVSCPWDVEQTYIHGCDQQCKSSDECDQYMACCYNGCAQVCVSGVMTSDSGRLVTSAVTTLLMAALLLVSLF